MTRDNMLKKSIISLMGLSIIGCITGITYAWFGSNDKVKLTDIYEGLSSGAYFAYGDGESADSAFGINEPRHLYNLAWLQYMGMFNQDENNDGAIDHQYYFEIDENLVGDLDMSGYVLPPIGTEEYPFVGTFNGNGKTVSNLTISNYIGSGYITDYPYTVESSDFNGDSQLEIIGFFGVVGYIPTETYDFSISSAINSVSNLYLDNIVVKNNSNKVLAGLLAGYVNAPFSISGVHYSGFDIKNGTSNIDDTTFTKVSKYTIFGDINADRYSYAGAGGGGQQNDFGGSIDFASFDKRVSYVIGSKTSTRNTQYTKTGINGNVYPLNANYYWSTENTYTTTAGLGTGSYMPLNVDLTKLTTNNNDLVSYDVSSGEPVLETNTGYITGYGTGSNTTTRIGHSLSPASSSSGGKDYLYKSISSYSSDVLFDSSNYSFLYYDSNSRTTYRLADSDNSTVDDNGKASMNSTFNGYSSSNDLKIVGTDIIFQKYDSVKKDFLQTLGDGTTDSQKSKGTINIHGMRIYSKSGNTISTYGKIKASNVTIDKTKYNSYELYQGGINFTLSKSGYVTMVVDTYTNSQGFSGSSNKDGFFTLYEITRSQDKTTISSSPTKINTIYKVGSTIEYNQTDTNGKTLSFDFSQLNSGQYLEGNALFYFEFPLTAGDYFFTEENNAQSPYILYLDIGANNSSESGEDEKVELTVDFVFKSNVEAEEVIRIIKITETAYGYHTSDVLFEITGTSTSDVEYRFRRSTPSDISDPTDDKVYYYSSGSGLSITNTSTGATQETTNKDCNS